MRDLKVSQHKLDFLRGVAALVVLVNHTRGSFYAGGEKILADNPTPIDYLAVAFLQLTSFSIEAVVLFFVLSGFAMAHSVKMSRSTERFYLKRAIRIWPVYLAATLIAFGIAALIGRTDLDGRFWEIALYWNPSSALTPQFWSLPYEVVFYLFCPLLLASANRVRVIAIAAATMFAATALFVGVKINPYPWFALNFLGNELLFFAAGAMAYYHLDRVPVLSWRQFALFGLFAVATIWVSKRAIGEANTVSMLLTVGVSVLLLRNLPERDWGWANLGSFSYSLYVFHYALLVLATWLVTELGIIPAEITNPVAWILVVPPILAACFVLYWVTERPCNLLLVRIRTL